MLYNALLYLTGWPLAFVLILGGLYFSFRTKFVQIRMFPEVFRVLFKKNDTPDGISSFGALMISTASRVGTGNIIGVSTAICLGGPGSLFWMWIFALIGGASAFVESTLAQIYKRKNPDGTSYGGPSAYIEIVCRSKFWAVVFAIVLIFTYGVGYNMLASYNLQSSFSGFSFYTPSSCWKFGAVVSVLFLICILGGCKQLIKLINYIVPFMGIGYISLALITLCINFKFLPEMFSMIFRDAFNFKPIFSGFSGSVIMYGLKRGLYSNEAGIGSAPNAAATAAVSHPVQQGLVQMFSVFLDTNILCMATGFICLSSGITPTHDLAGAPYVQNSMQTTFGLIGPVFIAIAMVLFAFTTLLGNFFYVENGIAYLCGKMPGKAAMIFVRIIGGMLIFLGAGMKMSTV